MAEAETFLLGGGGGQELDTLSCLVARWSVRLSVPSLFGLTRMMGAESSVRRLTGCKKHMRARTNARLMAQEAGLLIG